MSLNFGGNLVKFRKSEPLKRHTCSIFVIKFKKKKHCFYSWPVYATMIFEKKFHLAEWGAFYQMGKFSHFQGSISSLCLKIWLRLSLLTYRNSYFIYPKKVFSMTLNLNIKVKWHFGYLFFLSPQKVSQNCLKTYLITKN